VQERVVFFLHRWDQVLVTAAIVSKIPSIIFTFDNWFIRRNYALLVHEFPVNDIEEPVILYIPASAL